MSLFRIWARISSTPWAITPEMLDTIVAIARRTNESPEAVAARMGRELENTYQVEMRGNVAVIPVHGPLFRRAAMLSRVSGATDYGMIAQDFTKAMEDPDVTAVVLDIDSPGGDAMGISELAGIIAKARGTKPIIAYCGSNMASAAYWLGSAADRIVISSTAMLGSVGVVFSIETKKDEDTIEIVSSQSPDKRLDVTSEAGRSKLQVLADQLAAVFVSDVANNRGVEESKVLSDFGQGNLLMGQAAVDAGMADSIGTFEELIESLQGESLQENLPIAGQQAEMEVSVMAQANTATPAGGQLLTVASLKESHPGIVAEIQAAVEVPDVAAAVAAAVTAERERFVGILALAEAEGREALAMALAKQGSMTPEAAAEILAAAPAKKKGFSFMAAMEEEENPDVGADEDEDEENAEEDDVEKAVARSAALGKQLGIR